MRGVLIIAVALCWLPGTAAADDFSVWSARSRAPLPPLELVEMHHSACPSEDPSRAAGGCVQATMPVRLYVEATGDPWSDQRTFYHELGHAFDLLTLTSLDRAKIMYLFDERPPWTLASGGGFDQPAERFAEEYRFCALHGADMSRRTFRRERDDGTDYDYLPTYNEQRAVCRLIARAASRRG